MNQVTNTRYDTNITESIEHEQEKEEEQYSNCDSQMENESSPTIEQPIASSTNLVSVMLCEYFAFIFRNADSRRIEAQRQS